MSAYMEAAKAIVFNEIMRMKSKVNGRRNYTIVLETKYNTAYVGTHGAMRRRGFMDPVSIDYMGRVGLCWLHYTYKKDYNETIEELKNSNYDIHTII